MDESVSPSEDASEEELPCPPSRQTDGETMELLWQLRSQRRQSSPELPETVTRLTAPDGSVLYLVGTAHFSDSSKKDVAMVSRRELTRGFVQSSMPLTTFLNCDMV
ncbi:TraB domain-containing protein [Liparis tanakae]|uniref:TraB domain-containing protein n=1 Tax=Liparis tanakae TaxID=230148 RepID=A0A4Z2HRR7_9TELE|nr:TraB domain-containing protein [Liparis tanakae]